MPRLLLGLISAAALGFLCASIWLGRVEGSGTAQAEVVVPGGIPATLRVPGVSTTDDLPQPEPGAAPPGVVLVHGYAGDRVGMSTLARRLVRAGYAVLTPDLMGHGANRNPFQPDAQWDRLSEDVGEAVDFLRVSGYVDGTRISVVGHSMGAGAVLRLAERDSGIDAAVMLSGGWALFGPYRPPNALFVVAEHDPRGIRESAAALAARLADLPEIAPDQTRGDPALGTAVGLRDLAGNDHTTILFAPGTAHAVVDWLDAVYGVSRPEAPVFSDARLLALGMALLALPWLVVGLGFFAGRLAPAAEARDGDLRGLGALGVALLATLPLAGLAPVTGLLALDVADAVSAHWLYAGVALLVWLALRGELRDLVPVAPGRHVAAAGVAFVGWLALITPVGVVVHRVTPTPERALTILVATAIVLPFAIAFEQIVRGGSGGAAFVRGLAGRALVLGALLLGVAVGVLPFVIVLLIGPLALVLVLLELTCAALRARTRHPLAPALLSALVLAWTFGTLLPIRV